MVGREIRQGNHQRTMKYDDGVFVRYIQVLREEKWPIPYDQYDIALIPNRPAVLWWRSEFLAEFLNEDEIISSILPSYKR